MATEPATETTLQGPAAWEEQAEKEHVHGLGPWKLGLRRLRRNKVALLFGFLFVLLVVSCALAPVWADKVAKTDGHGEPPVGRHQGGRQGQERGRARRRADRAAVAQGGRKVLPRRRPQRPRHHGAAALRRPQLAPDRHHGGADHGLPVDRARVGVGLLPRRDGHGDPRPARRHVVVPRDHPRHRARRCACAWRAQDRADTDRGRLAGDSHLHHRARLHPVYGPADPRPGALAPREGVRGGRARTGRRPDPDHVQRGAAEPCVDDPRLLHAPDRQRDPARGGAVLPRRGRAAAEPVVGHDDRRGRRPHRDRAAPRRRAGC